MTQHPAPSQLLAAAAILEVHGRPDLADAVQQATCGRDCPTHHPPTPNGESDGARTPSS